MRKTALIITALGLLLTAAAPSQAEVTLDGFLQGLYGARLDEDNPTSTEHTASETRLQLRAEHFGDRAEFFGRLDFVWDGSDTVEYDWELREGYLKFRLGKYFDFKVGRQILTWGTGDLIFINDVFAKDYRSFFIGRDDQYLKAPQNAIRAEFYHDIGSLSLVWTPRFEANRLPTGRRLSYFNPMAGDIVGTGLGDEFYFDPPLPEPKFENGEIATRFQRTVGNFNAAVYFYKGFYKNPMAMDIASMTAFYPILNVYGASMRGAAMGGILWLEGGYFDSREDKDGDNPFIPNSSLTGMVGFERQVAANLTVNGQWQFDYMTDYDIYKAQQPEGVFVRDEVKHLFTSRVTKRLNMETVTLSGFVFYSPSDEDAYIRLSAEYKYTDEITLMAGGNIFDGNYANTDLGRFAINDNAYVKITYGF
ncbi:MAG: hypothetical protein JSV52_14190 [Candidatus Zixiibacteriota bacterium]|nr:MAG: hypothetical protein JSV52_14190 [candidate division Zixibacteria bacterium]